jgi:hypothetical protein
MPPRQLRVDTIVERTRSPNPETNALERGAMNPKTRKMVRKLEATKPVIHQSKLKFDTKQHISSSQKVKYNKKQQISLAAIHLVSTVVRGNPEASQSVPSLGSHELAHDAPAKHLGPTCHRLSLENHRDWLVLPGVGRQAASLHPVHCAPIVLGREQQSWGSHRPNPWPGFLYQRPVQEPSPPPLPGGQGKPDSDKALAIRSGPNQGIFPQPHAPICPSRIHPP